MSNLLKVLTASLFVAFLLTSETDLQASASCGQQQYSQSGVMCDVTVECEWDSGEYYQNAYEGWEDSTCENFDIVALWDYGWNNYGPSVSTQLMTCSDHCNPFYNCGTYGTFQIYWSYYGTCPS